MVLHILNYQKQGCKLGAVDKKYNKKYKNKNLWKNTKIKTHEKNYNKTKLNYNYDINTIQLDNT